MAESGSALLLPDLTAEEFQRLTWLRARVNYANVQAKIVLRSRASIQRFPHVVDERDHVQDENEILRICDEALADDRRTRRRTRNAMELLEKLLTDLETICIAKEKIFSRIKRELAQDIIAAYVSNCLLQNWKRREITLPRVQSLIAFSNADLRYKLNNVHIIGVDIAANAPQSFCNLRWQLRDELYLLTDLEERSHQWAEGFFSSFLQIWLTVSSPSFIHMSLEKAVVILMLTADLICTIVERNGFSEDCKRRVDHLMRASIGAFAERSLLVEIDMSTFGRYMYSANGPRREFGLLPTHSFNHLKEANISEKIRKKVELHYVPLSSVEFKGSCYVPVPRLEELTYNVIPPEALTNTRIRQLQDIDRNLIRRRQQRTYVRTVAQCVLS